MSAYLTYEMFGAVGNGIADDLPAIVQTHAEANRLRLPVKARPGAVYYLSPKALTALVQTSADWTGASFVINDVDCARRTAPIFHVASALEPLTLSIGSMVRGQTRLENPFGCDLHVVVQNSNHMDYIRKGLNQNNGHPRTDVFILQADGLLSSPLSFDFDQVTSASAFPIDPEPLTLTGGEFTTIANQAESRYNYHSRNIRITRSNVEVRGITHLVKNEKDHGAPYIGFIQLEDCARVSVHDCTFTAHAIYTTIGSAGLPVPMGSYDIRADRTASICFARCTQTTDIHDSRYWGLISTNFCRDLTFEDCSFSRFDAHMGVSNCTLRRCRLGWQCLNAIGNGVFLIEDVQAHGNAFVNLRDDYGCTWQGEVVIRSCAWVPRTNQRAVFSGRNDGTHDFGYACYMPNVDIDGLTIMEQDADGSPLYIFNDYLGKDAPAEAQRFKPIRAAHVHVKNVHTQRPVQLCEEPSLMPETDFTLA